MDLFTIVTVAVGLSMDAFAVSVTNGMCVRDLNNKRRVLTALSFGIFQAAMPIIGYFLGRTFSDAISAVDHWVALILLSAIGINMIVEAIKSKNEECSLAPFSYKSLFVQSIATSIDALAVGISFAVLNINIWVSALFIGAITFGICLFGIFIGKKLNSLFKNKASIVGGVILIAIGLKIFIEHTIL